VLEAFAVEGGAAGGGAEEEALGRMSPASQMEVADALEAEHRVVDVERDHRHADVGVGGAGGDEGRHGAGFGDAFLEDLAVLGLVVVAEGLAVDRLVELALGRVDADLAEQASMPKVRASSGMMGTMFCRSPCAEEAFEQPTNAMVVDASREADPLKRLGESPRGRGRRGEWGGRLSFGDGAAEGLAAFADVPFPALSSAGR
jgi:hypothetical protein